MCDMQTQAVFSSPIFILHSSFSHAFRTWLFRFLLHKFFRKMSRKVYEMWFELMELLLSSFFSCCCCYCCILGSPYLWTDNRAQWTQSLCCASALSSSSSIRFCSEMRLFYFIFFFAIWKIVSNLFSSSYLERRQIRFIFIFKSFYLLSTGRWTCLDLRRRDIENNPVNWNLKISLLWIVDEMCD